MIHKEISHIKGHTGYDLIKYQGQGLEVEHVQDWYTCYTRPSLLYETSMKYLSQHTDAETHCCKMKVMAIVISTH